MTSDSLERRAEDPVRQAEERIVECFNDHRGNRSFGEILRAVDPQNPALGHAGDALDNLLRKGVYGVQPTAQDPKPLKYNPTRAQEKGYV